MKILSIVIILLASCRELKHEATFNRYNVLADTGYLRPYFQEETTRQEHLNLLPMTNGVDSFELRLWFYGPSFAGDDLFIIKYDTNWKAYHYFLGTIRMPHEKTIRSLSDTSFVKKNISPAHGWEIFVDSLARFQLDTLPTQFLIPGFKMQVVVDGYAYKAEIATKQYYRSLLYSHPDAYDLKQSKIFAQFVEFIKRNFGNDPQWINY